VPLIVNSIKIPVIAAGGIMNGSGIAASLALGAEGAQLGTAFIACPETIATDAHRRLLASGATPTEVTSIVSGRPARGFTNQFMNEYRDEAENTPAFPVAYEAMAAMGQCGQDKGLL
jgi:nitronate monooxygenase